jgi:hypothetical protein
MAKKNGTARKPPEQCARARPSADTAIVKNMTLAELATFDPGNPVLRADILGRIQDILDLSISQTKSWTTKAGDEVEVSAPNYGAAVRCLELAARILRIVGPDAVIVQDGPSRSDVAKARHVLQSVGWTGPAIDTEGESDE